MQKTLDTPYNNTCHIAVVFLFDLNVNVIGLNFYSAKSFCTEYFSIFAATNGI
jgi:hypothetical protein